MKEKKGEGPLSPEQNLKILLNMRKNIDIAIEWHIKKYGKDKNIL